MMLSALLLRETIACCQRSSRGFGRPPATGMGIIQHGAYALTDPPSRFWLSRPDRRDGLDDLARRDVADRLGAKGGKGIGFDRGQPLVAVLCVRPLVLVRVVEGQSGFTECDSRRLGLLFLGYEVTPIFTGGLSSFRRFGSGSARETSLALPSPMSRRLPSC